MLLGTSEALWKDAYKGLKEKEPGLVQLLENVSGASFASQEQTTAVVQERLLSRDEKQWIIKLAGKSIRVREYGERVTKFVLWSKDIVSSALSSQPNMALAWTGITLLLPVCAHEVNRSLANLCSWL